MQLSIIIPFGTSTQRPYIKERVIDKAQNAKLTGKIEYLFVEGYSSDICEELPTLIKANGHQYLKDESQQEAKAFSLGKCRNIGIAHANAPVVMVLDVDYYLSLKALEKILEIIEIKQIAENPNAFLILPCVFLSKEGSENLLSVEEDKRESLLIYDINSGKNLLNKFFTPASSSFVMNRHKFLEIGGNDPSFVGHGYEDFDLMFRILKTCATFESLPKDLDFDYRNWNFRDFKGFRAWFSVVGYESIFYGIWLYHLWHIEPNQDGYLGRREINHQKFYKNLKRFKKLSDSVDCLQDKEAINKKVLVFTQENSSTYQALRGVSIYIGELICKREYEFFCELPEKSLQDSFEKERFLSFLRDNEISYVLFPNSYGNEQRIVIYQFVKESRIPYIVFERGAFADSWFFDTRGCNYDSTSYAPKYWDKPLSPLQILQTQEYIQTLLQDEKYLEKQGERIGGSALRRKLGIRHKKVIFVPLQLPSDTAILHFTYEPFSFDGFLEIVERIAKEYEKDDVVFVAKKHPLHFGLDKERHKALRFVPDETNFLDLLEIACGVVLLNSGCGMYAMIAKKPCVVCGNAFYHHQGLNLQARDEEELREQVGKVLRGEFVINNEKMLRFVHYLWKEFYSYGVSKVRFIKEENRLRNQVVSMDYYRIVIDSKVYLDAKNAEKSVYNLNALAYKPYLYEILHTKPTLDISRLLLFGKVGSAISHTKCFRLTQKLIHRPKDFVMDSKNPLIKPFRIFVRR